MIRTLVCMILVYSMFLAGTAAMAGTPMPIPPSQEAAALGPQPEPPDLPSRYDIRALGPQPEPPDRPSGYWDWVCALFRGILPW